MQGINDAGSFLSADTNKSQRKYKGLLGNHFTFKYYIYFTKNKNIYEIIFIKKKKYNFFFNF